MGVAKGGGLWSKGCENRTLGFISDCGNVCKRDRVLVLKISLCVRFFEMQLACLLREVVVVLEEVTSNKASSHDLGSRVEVRVMCT